MFLGHLGGLWLYLKSRAPLSRGRQAALLAMLLFLLSAYTGSVFGPPPPEVAMITWGAISMWVFVPWAWWIDRSI
jgi:hypothetical protein